MKKILMTIAAVLFLGSIATFASDTLIINSNSTGGSESSEMPAIMKPDVRVVNTLEMPWSKSGLAQSELVITRGEYTIWRVEADMLRNIPSCSPVGNSYHYFVYKNGEFLFTVNDCNKETVFDYFSNQQS